MPNATVRDGVYKRTDRPGWWVTYIDSSGNRVRRKCTAQTRSQAMTLLSKIKTQEERKRALSSRPVREIPTAALLERFMRHQKTRLRPTTYERLGGTLRTLQANLPEQATAITKQVVVEYIETRSKTVKPGTVAKEVSTLKHCLRLAVDWGLLYENAASRARLPEVAVGQTRYLTPTELQTALENAPEWLRAPIAFAVCTGIRRGEMLALRWMDVDLEHRRIHLRETNSDSQRTLPLSDDALYVLRSLVQGGPLDKVFAGIDALRLSVTTRRVFQRLGIMDASFHTLRHTSASWLVQHGVDLNSVGKILGLKTPHMTQRYAHLSPVYAAATDTSLDTAAAKSLDRQIAQIPRRLNGLEAIDLSGTLGSIARARTPAPRIERAFQSA
jgi:integrase